MDTSTTSHHHTQELENQAFGHGQQAVAMARSSSDIGVLVATFAGFSFATSAYFIISSLIELYSSPTNAPDTGFELLLALLFIVIGGLLTFGLILGFGMFLVRMQRQTMLGNSLQVQYSDYAWLRDWTNQVAADLKMPQVEIYITQDPVINAYAMGFMKPYIIVLNSGAIRYLTKEELKVVAVHEMAHIKYAHTIASVFLAPFLMIPVINIAAGWLSGFWQRRAELTADRLALLYMRDSELVKRALIKVHVGPDVAQYMNETARQWLQYTAERPMNRFAQTFSAHPFLVRRLSHIDRWKPVIEPQTAQTPVQPV